MKNQFNVSIFSNYSVSINFANVIRVRKISNIEFQIRFKTDTITDKEKLCRSKSKFHLTRKYGVGGNFNEFEITIIEERESSPKPLIWILETGDIHFRLGCSNNAFH